MIQQIIEYKNILGMVEEMINKSPFKKKYIIDKIGIPAPTYYRKLKEKTFTPDELLEIVKLLNPKEALLLELQKSENEYKKGDVMEHSEVMRQLRQEFS